MGQAIVNTPFQALTNSLWGLSVSFPQEIQDPFLKIFNDKCSTVYFPSIHSLRKWWVEVPFCPLM